MRASWFRLAVTGVVALLGSLIVVAVAVGDSVYTDPTGDATGGAPDLTQVAVSNDATGKISFVLTTVAPLEDGGVVGVDLDTDNSPANGPEYELFAGVGGAGHREVGRLAVRRGDCDHHLHPLGKRRLAQPRPRRDR